MNTAPCKSKISYIDGDKGGAHQIMPATSSSTTCETLLSRVTGARAKAWCLLIHAEASLSLSRSLL